MRRMIVRVSARVMSSLCFVKDEKSSGGQDRLGQDRLGQDRIEQDRDASENGATCRFSSPWV